MYLDSIIIVVAIAASTIVAFRVHRNRALLRARARTRALLERAGLARAVTNEGGG
jgi:hypothetical protein